MRNSDLKYTKPCLTLYVDAHGDSYEDEVRNFELREAARQRRLERNEVDPGRRNLQEALTGSSAQSTDMYQRARTPYSTGFIFTVRPDEGSANASAERPRQQQSLLKKAAETKSGGKVQLQKKMKELHTQGKVLSCPNASLSS